MKPVRVTVFACVALIVCALALSAAPPVAPTLPTNDAAFLASLAALAPQAPAVSGVGVPTPTPMSCPTGFCAAERLECQQSCAPCLGTSVCVISICDSTCFCQCS